MQTVEDETARRIEFLVKKRVEEELEKRKDEIEAEVTRRVEAAKVQMEREMMLELEKRREAARLEEQKREVNIFNVDADNFKTFSLFDFVSFSLILLHFWFSVSSIFLFDLLNLQAKLKTDSTTHKTKQEIPPKKQRSILFYLLQLFSSKAFCMRDFSHFSLSDFCIFFSFTTRIIKYFDFPSFIFVHQTFLSKF